MRKRRRKVFFSTVAALERIWVLKRAKTPKLSASFPGLSGATLFRALRTLEEAGLVRPRRAPPAGRVGNPPRIWRPTDRGGEILRILMPYRDLWERIDNRDVAAIAAGVVVLDKLEKLRINFFPLAGDIDPRAAYFRRHNKNIS